MNVEFRCIVKSYCERQRNRNSLYNLQHSNSLRCGRDKYRSLMSNERAMWHLSLHFSRNSITSSHLCTRNGSFIFNRCTCFCKNNATLFHHVPFSETVILSGTSTLCILALKNISRLIRLLFFIDLTKPSRL